MRVVVGGWIGGFLWYGYEPKKIPLWLGMGGEQPLGWRLCNLSAGHGYVGTVPTVDGK